MIVTIVVSLITLIVGLLIGAALGSRSRNNFTIQFDIKPADIVQAGQIPNKEEVLVTQQITISSLISVLAKKELTDVEKEYVLKAIEVAAIIPAV